MTTNFLAKGTDFIQHAVEKDNAESYEEALELYSNGISYLLTALKYEKNKKIIDVIRGKAIKYLKRAEEIKDALHNQQNNAKGKGKGKGKSKGKKPRLKTGANASPDNKENNNGDGEEEEEEDEEVQQLQSGLCNAIVIDRPNVQWNDVAGLEVAKSLLKEAVILPIRFPQLFTGKRTPFQGILLYGPPGTGKSYLAKAVANEANKSTFFSVSSSDLISKYVGESEKLIKNLFVLARKKKPSIIFIDEIDSLATKRGDNDQDSTRRVKTELLVQMQGVGKECKGVLVLGATNCPWDLDPAVRRRFAKRVYIPLPEKAARKAMFIIHTGKDSLLSDPDFGVLADRTDGFSGSDIAAVVQDALMEPVRTLQHATHFKKVPMDAVEAQQVEEQDRQQEQQQQNEQMDVDVAQTTDYVWLPCSSGDPHGVACSLMDFDEQEHEKIRTETLKLSHFLRVLQNANPSVGKADIQKHMDWTEQYGQEGR
eukprot:CAMPEP_0202692372 /NCGR_PEP_ID=MMETSP1385-20130828/6770_1 /ASSEMBLY_ACC=CAM_ASM_000861 /TAXON_ID=933848 /ORGANISM="Elphidium margaritaceum" /LENGTH=481 /DNA_ID=CAMNT_0049347895 /DNA_START=28 /DNA_END=1473 /DNA_ORIENTATION=+